MKLLLPLLSMARKLSAAGVLPEAHAQASSAQYIIAIQGASCSGKTSFAKFLTEELSKKDITTYPLSLDSFYKNKPVCPEKIAQYDFDNPAAYAWDSLEKTLAGLLDHSQPSVQVFSYEKSTMASIATTIPNPRARVIILEGLYAFNILSERCFNVAAYDELNSRKPVPQMMVPNPYKLGPYEAVRIYMDVPSAKALEERLKRDSSRPDLTLASITERFKTWVWPAVERWGLLHKDEATHTVNNGSFNDKCVVQLSNIILEAVAPAPIAEDDLITLDIYTHYIKRALAKERRAMALAMEGSPVASE